MEQVCRATAEVCRDWLRRLRGTNDLAYTLEVISYHQARNAAARASKKRREPIVRNRKKPRPKRKNKLKKRSAASRT